MSSNTASITRRHIDPHVHFRDWSETNKFTIGEGMALARSQGIVAVGDMPNTSLKLADAEKLIRSLDRPLPASTATRIMGQLEKNKGSIVTEELVELRMRTAVQQIANNGYYMFIGATSDPEQIRVAARVATEHPNVIGIKMYAGKSTGSLAMTDEKDQEMVYKVLKQGKYRGVLAVHCEHEPLARPELWVPSNPSTWNLAKPPEMEIYGVTNQVAFALESDFSGHLHICHTSTPEAAIMVSMAKPLMSITAGVTPHHLLYSTDDMKKPESLRLKVNPPIREKGYATELMGLLRDGIIDIIETDHAPHTKAEKSYDPTLPKESYMSGIRSMEGYSKFLDGLVENGGFMAEQIERLTYSNVKNIFQKIKE